MNTAVALILVLLSAAIGVIVALRFAAWRAGRRGGVDRVVTQHITERVRSVGRLVALEVCAKEIATATRGIADGWLPPLLLSPARVAMIFQFRKQYFVDLSAIGADDVCELPTLTDDRRRRLGLSPARRVRVTLPALESDLALSGVTPYDIQAGRVLGLVDVIPMNAERQAELMHKAQSHAAQVFDDQDDAYRAQAADAVEAQLRSLLGLMGLEVELVWRERAATTPVAALPATARSLPSSA